MTRMKNVENYLVVAVHMRTYYTNKMVTRTELKNQLCLSWTIINRILDHMVSKGYVKKHTFDNNMTKKYSWIGGMP